MKIVYNDIIPFKGYKAVNILSVMFARRGARVSDVLVNHERIHTAQMREMLYVFFYAWYVLEWLVRLVCCFNSHKAYKNISLEREAYENERNGCYISERKHYCWIKNIIK